MRASEGDAPLATGRTRSETTPLRSRVVTMMASWWRRSFILPLSEWGGWNARNSFST